MRRNVIPLCVVCALLGALAASPAQAKPQWSYAVKFVCGFNPSNVGYSIDGNREGEPTVICRAHSTSR